MVQPTQEAMSEEDEKRIDLIPPDGYSHKEINAWHDGAWTAAVKYWNPKLQELNRQLKERDELLKEMATLLSGTYKPSEWVSAVEKTKEVLTRYSNLKAK